VQNLWVFADPVFGPTPFTGKVLDLINTAELTRLRDIKQLSTACLFYPAATHSRFQHSLGMARLVKDFLINVLEEPHIVALLVYASIVHDIGHAAWGHAGELFMEYRGIPLEHSDLSSRLVAGDSELTRYFDGYGLPLVSQVLNEEERILVSKLVLGKPPVLPKLKSEEEIVREEKETRYLRQIIASRALDFDRLEYLIRDGFYTTTAASFFRLKDVFESLIVSEVGGAKELMFGNRDFAESFVITRELMYSGVYQQPRDLVAGEMLARAFNLCFVPSADPYEVWFNADEELLQEMYSNEKSRQIARLIKNRQIYTILYENDFSALSALPTPTVRKLKELTKPEILKVEEDIAKPELEAWQVLVCVRIAPEPKEADAWVMTRRGPEPLRRISPLVAAMTQEYRDSRSRVVLAVYPQTSDTDKNKVLKRFKDYFGIPD